MSVYEAHSPQDMMDLGAVIGRTLQAGDVVVLHGPLGAGKTTLVRGLGEALGVDGLIQSPTFVVARVHQRTDSTQPPVIHVDAYRLTHHDEIVDLDLDIDHSITLIEWGRPYAEHLVEEWLDVDIQRATDDVDEDIDLVEADSGVRVVTLSAHSRSGQPSRRFDDVMEAVDASRH
ncbi:MAG: tRNA (adenosine(37)-N6)-threonylcarbamoyltransferase complex ATPase subunit type 1 TsaE [Pontimonas sp.]